MGRRPFANPVKFMVSNRLVRQVTDTEEALQYLQTSWPIEGGSRYQAARKILAETIEGDRPVKEARRAMVRALDEAGLIVVA